MLILVIIHLMDYFYIFIHKQKSQNRILKQKHLRARICDRYAIICACSTECDFTVC